MREKSIYFINLREKSIYLREKSISLQRASAWDASTCDAKNPVLGVFLEGGIPERTPLTEGVRADRGGWCRRGGVHTILGRECHPSGRNPH